MRRTIRDIGCPAIDNVFTKWQTQVRNVSKAAAGVSSDALGDCNEKVHSPRELLLASTGSTIRQASMLRIVK